MKSVACLIALGLCAAIVYGEECFTVDDCDHESCDTDYALGCDRGECTCDLIPQTCLYPEDCGAGSTDSTDAECNGDWHCYDNSCNCQPTFGGGFGGGDGGFAGFGGAK